MENASKALIIAGAVLITIIVISLSVVVFQKMSANVKDNTTFTEKEMENFNAKITPYCGEKISGSQVNSLIQYVYALNNDPESFKIEITYPTVSGGTAKVKTDGNYSNLDHKRVQTGVYYKVTPTYGNNGFISSIKVEK